MISVEPRSTVVQCGRAGRDAAICFSRGGGNGCDAWEREPGLDDDDWDPPGIPRIAPYVPEPPPAPRSRSPGVDGWWTEPRKPRPAPAPRAPVWIMPSHDLFGGIYSDDD